MRGWSAALLLAAALPCARSGLGVLDLTASNFDAETEGSDVFIKFYAPWCGHCKRLAPTWDQLSTQDLGNVKVARVDCTQHRRLGDRFGVKGFPTLLFMTGGKLYKYKGDRSLKSLSQFATSGWADTSEYDPFARPPPGPDGRGTMLEEIRTLSQRAPKTLAVIVFFSALIIVVTLGVCIYHCCTLEDDEFVPGRPLPRPAAAAAAAKLDDVCEASVPPVTDPDAKKQE